MLFAICRSEIPKEIAIGCYDELPHVFNDVVPNMWCVPAGSGHMLISSVCLWLSYNWKVKAKETMLWVIGAVLFVENSASNVFAKAYLWTLFWNMWWLPNDPEHMFVLIHIFVSTVQKWHLTGRCGLREKGNKHEIRNFLRRIVRGRIWPSFFPIFEQ